MDRIAQTISFPGIGIGEFSINRVAFRIPGVDWPIYWYGVIFALAFLLAIVYILKRVRDFGLDGDRVLDVILGAVVGGIIGARTYYVLFSWSDYQGHFLDVFKIWEGGIAIYGGVIGGVLAGFLMCKVRKVKFLPMADLALGGLILGQAIGRWGNFVNVEAFGNVTAQPWRMCSPAAADFLLRTGQIGQDVADQIVAGTLGVHPTFFYESAWCLIGFLLIVWFTSRRRFDGELALIYAAWYGLGRAVFEGLRTDSLMWGSVRVSQALAAALVVVSVAVLVYVRSDIKRQNDPEYLKLYVNTEEGQAVLAGTFYGMKQTENSELPKETAEDAASAEQPESDKGEDQKDESTID